MWPGFVSRGAPVFIHRVPLRTCGREADAVEGRRDADRGTTGSQPGSPGARACVQARVLTSRGSYQDYGPALEKRRKNLTPNRAEVACVVKYL